jgi:hypothetical protein
MFILLHKSNQNVFFLNHVYYDSLGRCPCFSQQQHLPIYARLLRLNEELILWNDIPTGISPAPAFWGKSNKNSFCFLKYPMWKSPSPEIMNQSWREAVSVLTGASSSCCSGLEECPPCVLGNTTGRVYNSRDLFLTAGVWEVQGQLWAQYLPRALLFLRWLLVSAFSSRDHDRMKGNER